MFNRDKINQKCSIIKSPYQTQRKAWNPGYMDNLFLLNTVTAVCGWGDVNIFHDLNYMSHQSLKFYENEPFLDYYNIFAFEYDSENENIKKRITP